MTATTPPIDMGSWYAGRTAAMRAALHDLHAGLERLTYAAGSLQFAADRETAAEVTARVLDLHGQLQQLDRLALGAISADSLAEHELTGHAERTGAPYAEWRVGAMRPVGLEEIAERLAVKRATADRWRSRGVLPEPLWLVSGSPLWPWAVIEAWARKTGRMPEDCARS
jgi:predicted DNA-binding transcriptional regulator AlpA